MPCGLSTGEAVELYGEPGTGKTALMLECALRCILPQEAAGHGCGAVVVDTQGGFDVLRLVGALHGRLAEAGVEKSRLTEATEEALGRLRIIQCHTPSELLLGLAALRARLEHERWSGESGGAPAPRVVLIDCASAFQWLMRGTQRAIAAARAAVTAGLPTEGGGAAAGGGEAVEAVFESELSALVAELLRQRLSIVWSRCPTVSTNGGRDFPSLHATWGGGPAASALRLDRPDIRVRLRRVDEAHAHAEAQLTVQAMTEMRAALPTGARAAAAAAAADAGRPRHYTLRCTMHGVLDAGTRAPH